MTPTSSVKQIFTSLPFPHVRGTEARTGVKGTKAGNTTQRVGP